MPGRRVEYLAIRRDLAEHAVDLAANAAADLDLEIESLERQLLARQAKRPHFAFRVQRLAAQLARLEEDLDQANEAALESECRRPLG